MTWDPHATCCPCAEAANTEIVRLLTLVDQLRTSLDWSQSLLDSRR